MPLVDAKCPNCGGGLKINNDKKAAICPYCKEAYIVQDAINNYNYVTNNTTHNTTNIENLSANIVQLNDDRTATARLKAAEAFMMLQEYEKADITFQEVCDLTPQDYRGWWGKIRAITHNFDSKLLITREEEERIDKYEDAAIKLASSETAEKMIICFNNYKSNLWETRKTDEEQLQTLLKEQREKDLQRIEKGDIIVTYGDKITSYDVLSAVKRVYSTYNIKMEIIRVPEGVSIIDKGAFQNPYYFDNLSTVVLPDGLKEIGQYAFSNCKALKSIRIPDSVKKIGMGAFSGCASLESIYIPNCYLEMRDNTDAFDEDIFYKCENLRTVEFGAGTKEIKGVYFWWNHNLKTVHIPDSVETVDQSYFCCKGNKCKFYYVPEIIASDRWKKQHCNDFACLASYRKGCYIATSIYGSYDCPEVWMLRRYRDNSLARTRVGRMFIKFYYTISPALVKHFGHTILFNRIFYMLLEKIINKLKIIGVEDTPYYD